MKDTKERIFKTAIELFKEKGYDNVSMNEICGSCGITTGSFYHHYKSKSEVLMDCFNNFYDESNLDMLLITSNLPYKEKVWMCIESAIDYAVGMGKKLLKYLWIIDLQNETQRYHPVYPKDMDDSTVLPEYCRLAIALLKKAQEEKEVKDAYSAEMLFFIFFSAYMSASLTWCLSEKDYDIKERVREIFDTVIN